MGSLEWQSREVGEVGESKHLSSPALAMLLGEIMEKSTETMH